MLKQDEKLSERVSGTVKAFQKTLFKKALHGQVANTVDGNSTSPTGWSENNIYIFHQLLLKLIFGLSFPVRVIFMVGGDRGTRESVLFVTPGVPALLATVDIRVTIRRKRN